MKRIQKIKNLLIIAILSLITSCNNDDFTPQESPLANSGKDY